MMPLEIKIALSAFWITYLIKTKECPFNLCTKFRELLDFKPFNCFFCFSSWICIVLYAFSFVFPTFIDIFATFFAILGISALIYLTVTNLFNKI